MRLFHFSRSIACSLVAVALVSACGKSVKKKDSQGAAGTPAAPVIEPDPETKTPPEPTETSEGNPVQGDGDSNPANQAPATAPVAPADPFEVPKSFVAAGGNQSGYLPGGQVYFAPNQPVFFSMAFQTLGEETTVIAEILANNAALLPQAEYQSAVHSGTCANKNSPRYQHIAGNVTPETSELVVVLKGTGTTRKGIGRASFAFRNEPISYVVQFGTQRLCADLVQNQSPLPGPPPIPCGPGSQDAAPGFNCVNPDIR